jgi:proprotein convertase subtilisin/kexin type 5
VATCSNGYYDNGLGICLNCDAKCALCISSPINCSKCISPNYLNGNTCGPTCPLGTWPNNLTNNCDPCPITCKACTSLSSCTSCNAPNFLYLGQCNPSCPNNGFYGDSMDYICKPCHPQCQRCFNPTKSDCTACVAPSYYLFGNNCDPTCPLNYFAETISQEC